MFAIGNPTHILTDKFYLAQMRWRTSRQSKETAAAVLCVKWSQF